IGALQAVSQQEKKQLEESIAKKVKEDIGMIVKEFEGKVEIINNAYKELDDLVVKLEPLLAQNRDVPKDKARALMEQLSEANAQITGKIEEISKMRRDFTDAINAKVKEVFTTDTAAVMKARQELSSALPDPNKLAFVKNEQGRVTAAQSTLKYKYPELDA